MEVSLQPPQGWWAPPNPNSAFARSLWLLLERLLRCLLLGLAQALLCTYFHSVLLLALLKAHLFPLLYSSFCRLVLSHPLSLTLLSILAWSKKNFFHKFKPFWPCLAHLYVPKQYSLLETLLSFYPSIHYLAETLLSAQILSTVFLSKTFAASKEAIRL